MIKTKLTKHLFLALSIVSLPIFSFNEASLARSIRTGSIFSVPAGGQLNLELSCQPGIDPFVESGGFDSIAIGRGFEIIDSYPLSLTTWGIRVRNNGAIAQRLRMVILCD